MEKFKKKIKNIHFLSLFGNGTMAIMNMVTMAILYRSLSVADNGIWIFYQTAVIFIDTFRTGLLNTAFVKFYSGTTKERGQEVVGSTWTLAIAVTILFIVLSLPFLFILKNTTNEGVKIFIEFMSLNLIFSIPTLIALCKAQGELRFDRILTLRVCNNGLFLLFVVILTVSGNMSLKSVVYFNLLAILFSGLFSFVKRWTGIESLRKKSWHCVKEIFNYGKFTVATSVSSNLFKVTDTFIINFMLGPAALAIYNLGQRLMEIVEIPLRSFTATAMPALSAAFNQNNKVEFNVVLKKFIGTITLILLPVLITGFFLSDFAIGLIGGGKYRGTDAANVFRLFITFALLYPADRFFSIGIDAIHKPNINFIKVIIMLVINLVCDYTGILIMGNVYGVAIATLFPTLFAVLFSYFYINKYYVSYNFWGAYRYGFYKIGLTIKKYLI